MALKIKVSEKDLIIKTTIRVSKTLWDRVRIRAIKENSSAEAIVASALREYLNKGDK